MRLAYVCLDPGVPVFGRKGSSVHCQEVIRTLIQRGFEVELFATRLGKDVPNDLQSVRCQSLKQPFSSDPATREKELVQLNPVVRQMLADSRPFDLVYERYSLWSYAAQQFARSQDIPGIVEVNSPLIEEQKEWRGLIDETGARRCQDWCFANADSLIAVSEQVAEKFRTIESVRSKICVIPNGVNCERFRPVHSFASREDPVIGFVGTLKPWHGVSILLDSFSILYATNPTATLLIVGFGPEEQNLRDQLAAMPKPIRSRVRMTGAVSGSDIPELLSEIDIAVAPYPELEQFYFSPLKILEYMAAGKAVVASNLGQIPDLILHGQTGLLVKPGCPQDLAGALRQLCLSANTRQQLGAAARSLVEEHHSWTSVIDRALADISFPVMNCGAK